MEEAAAASAVATSKTEENPAVKLECKATGAMAEDIVVVVRNPMEEAMEGKRETEERAVRPTAETEERAVRPTAETKERAVRPTAERAAAAE